MQPRASIVDKLGVDGLSLMDFHQPKPETIQSFCRKVINFGDTMVKLGHWAGLLLLGGRAIPMNFRSSVQNPRTESS